MSPIGREWLNFSASILGQGLRIEVAVQNLSSRGARIRTGDLLLPKQREATGYFINLLYSTMT